MDDASADGTAEVAERASIRPLVIRQRVAQGAGAARNAGVAAARSSLIAFTDADCVPEPDWLQAGVEALAFADLVQGVVTPDPAAVPRGPYDRSLDVRSESGLFEAANLFVRREAFTALGGFHEWVPAWRARADGAFARPIGEDTAFGWAVRRAGRRTAFCPQAVVHHAVFAGDPASQLRERRRLRHFPGLVARIPEMRGDVFYCRFFLSRRTAALDLALVGMTLAGARRSPMALVTVVPYAADVARRRRTGLRRAPRVAAVDVAGDLVGLIALLRGSVTYRRLLL